MKRHKLVARRRQLGESQSAIAHAVGVQRTTYARWEQGVTNPQLWNRRRLAEVLQVDEDQLCDLLEEPATLGGGATHRRDVLKLGMAAAVAPEVLVHQLREAAVEAASFTARSTSSSLGHGVVDHLQLAVADIARSYSRAEPRQLYGVALGYRRHVDRLLGGRPTLAEARELYTCAGWLSENLAWLANDLGSPVAADAYCVDAYEHAAQAGHDELCAWAMDARASIAMHGNRPAAAHDAALAGLAKAPAGHPLGVRLHAQAARASARLGDEARFRSSFTAARDGYDRLPTRPPDRFGKDTAKLAAYAITSYATTSYLSLGRTREAVAHAEAAIAEHKNSEGRDRSPTREAIARIDLASCLAATCEPDEATRLGVEALTSERVVDSVLTRASDLHTTVRRRHPSQADDLADALALARSGAPGASP